MNWCLKQNINNKELNLKKPIEDKKKRASCLHSSVKKQSSKYSLSSVDQNNKLAKYNYENEVNKYIKNFSINLNIDNREDNNKNQLKFYPRDSKRNDNNIKQIKNNNHINYIQEKHKKNIDNNTDEPKDYFRNKIETSIKKNEIKNQNQYIFLPQNSDENEIYGFINNGNNCYLNSSLQLLTRIKELKKNILILNSDKLNKSSRTRGLLTKEFQKILKDIQKGETKIDPENLKIEMSNIDDRYLKSNQEDANEFIANFLDGLLEETSSFDRIFQNRVDEMNREAYINFFNKFYRKKGNSFILDLFFGELRTTKTCKNCRINSVKFNPYNMLELPVYEIAKDRYGDIYLEEIFKNFFSEIKSGARCGRCGNEMITKNELFKLPKYLIIFFGRTVNNDYVSNNIIYNKYIELSQYMCNKRIPTQFELQSVIEHSGGAHYGHYTSLCYIESRNRWYYFSDTESSLCSDYRGNNAIILLYKSL